MRMDDHGMLLGFTAKFNDWYPMPEKATSNIERCLGF